MSAQAACTKCGKPLQAGDVVCGACGAIVAGLAGAPSLVIPDVASTGAPAFVTGLGPKPFAPVADVGAALSPALNLTFGVSTVERGRPYRPVFAVGRGKEGTPELRMPFALAPLRGGEFLVLHFVEAGGPAEAWRCAADGRRASTIGPLPAGSEDGALDAPAALAVDPQGNLLVLDMGANCVRKFSPDGRPLARFGGAGTEHERLDGPQGLAADAAGSLYVADTGNNRVMKWNAEGRFQWALGLDRLDPDGGMASGSEPGELDEPRGLCIGSEDAVYVADSNNHRIQVFSPTRMLEVVFGEEGTGPGQLYYPRVVRVNAQGDIFVADSGCGRVQKFKPDGQFVYQVLAPSDTGLVDDFLVDPAGRLVLALRKADLVLGIEIE